MTFIGPPALRVKRMMLTVPTTLAAVETWYPVAKTQYLHLSLSRLNHGQPGMQAHPEIVQGTAELHHQIAHARLPQADPVLHDATPLDAAVDMLDPPPPLVERLVGQVLLQGQLPTAGLLRRHEDLHLREREGQEAQLLQQPTASREWVGGGLRNAQIMDTAAVGVAQKEDDEERIDEQDIFEGVVLFLPTITRGLFSRVLGADDAPFGPVMGKRGEAASAAGSAPCLLYTSDAADD